MGGIHVPRYASRRVMPGLVPGIHVFLRCVDQDVDGRDKPGHDDVERYLPTYGRQRLRRSRHRLAALAPQPAAAQDLQDGKPIRVIVGLAAGGATDVMARLMAQKMSENMRTTVFVENRAGGNFIPALRDLTASPPDGHTLFFISTSTLITQPLHAGLSVRSDQAHAGHPGGHRPADPGGAQRPRGEEPRRTDRTGQTESRQAHRSVPAAAPAARSISRPNC